MPDLYEIDNEQILAMTKDANFVNRFPAIKALARKTIQTKTGGCGGCGGRRRVRVVRAISPQDIENAKRALAAMGAGQKHLLKKLLNAQQVGIKYAKSDGSGKIVYKF